MKRTGSAGKVAAARLLLLLLLSLSWTAARGEAAGGETPPPPPAATPPPRPPPRPSPPGGLDPIVVTAERLPTSRALSGSAVSVLSGEEIDAINSTELADSLRTLPGMSFTSQGARGNLTTLSMRGGNAHSTMLLVDGFRVNSVTDSLASARFETFPPLLIDRVEVVRGAASPAYGSDAVTGAVHLISKRGEGPFHGSFSAETGSGQTTGTRLKVSGGTEQGGLALEFRSLVQADGDGGDPFNPDGRDVEELAWALRGDYEPDERTRLKLVCRGSALSYENFSMGPGDTIHSKNALVGFEAGRRLASRWDSRLKLSFVTQSRRNEMIFGTTDTTDEIEARYALDWQNDIKLVSNARVRNVLTAGGELISECGGRTDTSALFGTNFEDSRTNQSLYLQTRLELADSLGLTTGVRHEWNSDYGSVTTGRVGLAWRIRASGTRFHASWGSSFRAPDYFSLAFGVGNPNLLPEENESLDAGVEQSLCEGRLRFGATFFQNQFTNLITFYDPTPGPPYLPQDAYFDNIRAARARGFEAELVARPNEHLLLRAALTTTSTKDYSTGGPISLVPERVVSVSIMGRPNDRVELFAGASFVGDRWQSGMLIPGYSRLDFAASVRLGRHAVLFGRLANVTDARYREAAWGDLVPRRSCPLGREIEW